MKTCRKPTKKRWQHVRPMVAMALITSGAFQLVGPALADGTTAGTTISNTATATYQDPNAPGTTLNAVSNPVVITVAEVAGITVTSSGTSLRTDQNGNGNINAGDVVNYDFTITNVGNDPTRFRIPNLATVSGPGTAGTLEYSTNGGSTWTSISGSELISGSIPAGGSIMVRVPVTVAAGATTGNTISVKLGDTPGDAQNQLRSPNGGDVYTVDNPDATGAPEVVGVPVNGVREASVTQQATVGSSITPQAFATILKTRTDYTNSGTASVLNDDVLTYGLSLRVESNDPTGLGLVPAPLVGTTIQVNGNNVPHILVSDAIPANTTLSTATPTAPPGWQVVYTTSAVTTAADDAVWVTARPGSGITRVGFINDPNVVTSVAPGATVTGFSFQVVASGVTTTTTIANIAQVFGQTSGGGTTLVYDESGDQTPSNYNPATSSFDNTPTDGYINDATDLSNTGSDSNNNSGTGTGGEANVYTINEPTSASLLNGTDSTPDAIGPTNNNDDFTNKSTLVPAGTAPGSTINPSSVGFTNTLQNSGTSAGTITLEPTAPANRLDLPNLTTVTITYGSESATYEYDQTTGTFTIVPGNTPISITNVAANAIIDYGVEVDLPGSTPLSTDVIAQYPGDTEYGFPVPITASIDTDGNGTVDAENTTIDRVYTGFLRLLKESRILQGTGPAVQSGQGTFSTSTKNPAPGNLVQYRITYTNISTPQVGSGNIILNASNIVITEDGTTGGNTWGLDNDGNNIIDTSNMVGSAADSGPATITFFSGNPATTNAVDQTGTTSNVDVTRYVNTVGGSLTPGVSRTFTFQRRVN